MNVLDTDFIPKAAEAFSEHIESISEDGRILVVQSYPVHIDGFFLSLMDVDADKLKAELMNDLSFLHLYPLYTLNASKFELNPASKHVLVDTVREIPYSVFELHYLRERLAVDENWSYYPTPKCIEVWQECMAHMRQKFVEYVYARQTSSNENKKREEDLAFLRKLFPEKVLPSHAINVLQRLHVDLMRSIGISLKANKNSEYLVHEMNIDYDSSPMQNPIATFKISHRLIGKSTDEVEIDLLTLVIAHVLGRKLVVGPNMKDLYKDIFELEKEIVL